MSEKRPRGGALKAIQQEIIRHALGRIRYKLLVLSGKGGVGKSTVAVNLAAMLLRKGHSVGLLDVDLHGPSVPGLLGLRDRMAVIHEDRTMDPLVLGEGFEVMSVESLLRDKDSSVIWRGPLKTSMIRQFVADVAWGDLDFLVVDAPPGTGDEPLTVAKTIPDAWAVVVTTPQEISLADVRKCIGFCRQLSMRIAGVVENMSGMICPHCGERIDVFKKGGGQRLAGEADVPFLGRIPLDPEMVRAGDAGKPLVNMRPDSETAQAYAAIVDRIVAGLEGAPAS